MVRYHILHRVWGRSNRCVDEFSIIQGNKNITREDEITVSIHDYTALDFPGETLNTVTKNVSI